MKAVKVLLRTLRRITKSQHLIKFSEWLRKIFRKYICKRWKTVTKRWKTTTYIFEHVTVSHEVYLTSFDGAVQSIVLAWVDFQVQGRVDHFLKNTNKILWVIRKGKDLQILPIVTGSERKSLKTIIKVKDHCFLSGKQQVLSYARCLLVGERTPSFLYQ